MSLAALKELVMFSVNLETCLCLILQVIRILKELKQKYPDKELDQLMELANYYALLHQQKSRAFYRVQVTHLSPSSSL